MALFSRSAPAPGPGNGAPPRVAMFLERDPRGLPGDKEFVWSGADLDGERLAALATSASFSFFWRAPCDRLAMFSDEGDPGRQISTWIEVLDEWWDATDGDDIRRLVRDLQSGLHSVGYEVVHPLVADALADEVHAAHRDSLRNRHQRFLGDIERFHGRPPGFFTDDYQAWFQALRLGGAEAIGGAGPDKPELPAHIMSWDLMRAGMLARAGVTVGYIDAEEAWAMLMRNLELARDYYANWGQYARGWVVGHLFWAAQSDVAAAVEETEERARMMIWCLDAALSPWRRLPLHPGTPFHGADGWTSFEHLGK